MIKITIEGPQGCGKTTIARSINRQFTHSQTLRNFRLTPVVLDGELKNRRITKSARECFDVFIIIKEKDFKK